LGFFGFFLVFFWFFGFLPNQTLPQKLKIGIGFFWFFLGFFGFFWDCYPPNSVIRVGKNANNL
jgi:hypothetical protein